MATSTWKTRRPDGTWTPTWTTVIDTAQPVEHPTAFTVVDRTSPTERADWQTTARKAADQIKSRIRRSSLTEHDCDDCGPGRTCVCTADSTDPLD